MDDFIALCPYCGSNTFTLIDSEEYSYFCIDCQEISLGNELVLIHKDEVDFDISDYDLED